MLSAFLAVSLVHLFGHANAVAAPPVSIETLARLPFPATLEPVVEHGAIEGYPVSVLRVRSALSVDEATAAARSAWSREHSSAVVLSRTAAWRIVSLREAGGFRTLQLRAAPGGGSEGLLSVWGDEPAPARARRGALDPVRLLPTGARVLRRLEGNDAGRRHHTLVALAQGSVRWVADSLQASVLAHGFRAQPFASGGAAAAATGAGGSPAGAPAEARTYRVDGRELATTVHEHHGQAAIVIHLTEADR